MATNPAPLIAAPQPLRRRYGLFDAASGPLDLMPHAAGGGIRYVPDTCGEAYVWGVNCYDGETAPPTKPLDPDNEVIETGVFAVLSTLLCTPIGATSAEQEAKVRRRLEGTEQAAVERALWTGLDHGGNSLGIRSIEATAVDVPMIDDPDAVAIAEVVAALERWAYTEQQYGFTAYLHAPVEVAAYAAEAGLIMNDGRMKVTPLGSVWSFGAYPAGQIAITGQTTVWRDSEVSVYQAFENATNELLTVAERAYAVGFDCLAGVAGFDPLEVTSP